MAVPVDDLLSEAASRSTLLRAIEPLWIAALGAQFIVLGSWGIPRLIRLLGRGGAVETVEWAVWMSTLMVFPPAVWIVGRIIPKVAGESVAGGVRRALVILALLEFAGYAVLRSSPSLVIVAVAGACISIIALHSSFRRIDRIVLLLMIACGTAGWMAAGGLVYWENALRWLTASPWTAAALAVSVIVASGLLRAWIAGDGASRGVRIIDLAAIAVLVAFSFRTFPVVEFFHWGFFVGPIDQLRDGGLLLWDTASQYGFLSILLPTLLPGSSWQSFWFFQAVMYSVVAVLMYFAFRRLADRWWSAAAGFLITFIVLFFRPRSASLLLPAQMTPAAGPFRFVWCFVLLAFLVSWYTGSRREDTVRFTITGTQIWAVSLLWSAESAIYVTAMWFPALVIRALQSASERGRAGTIRGALGAIVSAVVVPAAAVVVIAGVVFITYRIAFGFGPDLLAYFDYVLLYSRGGFGALPIDPTGIVWYLVILFLIVSTILGLHAIRNKRDPRLVVWAAAWGCVWSLASYFTGRSHPVNLIAIAPVLLFALVACMRLRPFDASISARYAMAAAILPLLAMPVTLTAGHASFAKALSEPQLPPSRFIDQVDLMDPGLQSLLVSAGAKPTDSFVLVGDGRLMLPAWNASGLPTAVGNPGRDRVWSTRSWLPKAFEIVGSLPEQRRQVYFARNAARFPGAGWLIQSKTLTASGADHFLRFAQASRPELRRFENDKWIVSWMGPAARPSD